MKDNDFEIYELKKYEIKALKEINEWEISEYDSFSKKFFDAVAEPFSYLINKIGKNNFEVVEKTIKKLVEQFYKASEYTVNPDKIMKRAKENGIDIKELSDIKNCYLKPLDDCNQKHIKFHEATAAVQGAIAGITGEIGAVIDISTIMIRDFHMIQNIAFCYGFNPNDILEKEIILRIIEAALGRSDVKKKAIYEIQQLKEKQKNHEEVGSNYTNILTSKATDRCIKSITLSLIARIIACSIPVLSMAISAHSNYEIMENSGKTALMVYRKRFIERKKEKNVV